MNWTTLISVEELALALDRCVLVDCRHDLVDPRGGLHAFQEAHIPSAHFLSMDEDLSGPANPALGRHPLPDRETLRKRLESLGLSDNTQLVVHDDQGGAMAGRLWMLARWIGHRNVAVLDGGINAWKRAGYPLTADPKKPTPGRLSNRNTLIGMLSTNELMVELENHAVLVVDARSTDRFSGENGAMDPVAGHIPGAINRPFTHNLRPDGRFKPAEVLRHEWETLLAGRSPEHVVHQCGSGVTANNNLLAMEIAGLTGSRLYPPSWSGWIHDPARPVARSA